MSIFLGFLETPLLYLWVLGCLRRLANKKDSHDIY